MPGRYPKQNWQSGTILSPYGPLGGARMQHLEDWLATIFDDHDAHVIAADPHPVYILKPGAPVTNGPLVYLGGGVWASQLLTNAQVDPAAAIAKSKLAALGIVDADVSAISISKLGGFPNDVTKVPRGDGTWGNLSSWTIGSSPPVSPLDGDIWVYNGFGSGVLWPFRYNAGSASAFKWEAIGPTPAFSEVTTPETTTSLTYVALSTPGPSIALPRSGDYTIETGFRLSSETAVSVNLLMSYDIGGTGAVDADAVRSSVSSGQFTNSVARGRPKSGLGTVTLTAKYRTDTAGTFGFADRWMRVTPIRVS